MQGVEKLGDVKTYTGYGDELGDLRLRKALSGYYRERGVGIDTSEIFISDGAKPDSANIQSIFSPESIIAVQDPAYPVYVDSNVIAGRTEEFNKAQIRYSGLVYMACNEKNNFIPDPTIDIPKSWLYPDLFYLCSPNNPTGAVMSKSVLEKFVQFARKHKSVIIFDAAYFPFISDTELPRSIYEVDGAKECAIEINSFSKLCGFTGVRLGWTVVPQEIVAEDSKPGELNAIWARRQTTFFNGASNIAQEGGLAALTEEGRRESQELVNYYMRNARIIKEGLERKGLKVFGGTNAPYLWMKNPNNIPSWEFFNKILGEAHVVCTPGVGFGPEGEGYTRLSAFGHREDIQEAVQSIERYLKI